MILFKDFEKKPRWLGLAPGPLETAVDSANAWVASHAVFVINIETIYKAGGVPGVFVQEQRGHPCLVRTGRRKPAARRVRRIR